MLQTSDKFGAKLFAVSGIAQIKYSVKAPITLFFIIILEYPLLHGHILVISFQSVSSLLARPVSSRSHKHLFHCRIFPHMHNNLPYSLHLPNFYALCKTQFPISSMIIFPHFSVPHKSPFLLNSYRPQG